MGLWVRGWGGVRGLKGRGRSERGVGSLSDGFGV